MIEAKEVVKRFENVTAVAGISLRAEPGEILGLIGPNGAGKSTTIRMIMNIIAPDSGQVLFDGRPIREEDKDRIGYLPEERGLYKKTKVADMLRYLARVKGAAASAAEQEIDAWLKRFGLSGWKDRKLDELSKGMAQKVQFIGAVAHRPSIVLFDEPFSGLDPVSAEILLEAMVALRDEGRTVLFSTHIMEHAERICNRIMLIDKGRQVAYGAMADIKARFGADSVALEYDGDGGFIAGLPYVRGVTAFPRYQEVELASAEDADKLLREVAGKIRIRRFELIQPSLHTIFLKLVGGKADGRE